MPLLENNTVNRLIFASALCPRYSRGRLFFKYNMLIHVTCILQTESAPPPPPREDAGG